MLNYTTVKFAKRGKGAKGFIEVDVIGKPILDDNGICRDVDYSSIEKEIEMPELMEAFQKKGYSIVQSLADQFNSLNREAAQAGGAPVMILREKIKTSGLLDQANDDNRESMLKAFVAAIGGAMMARKALGKKELSIDELIERFKNDQD